MGSVALAAERNDANDAKQSINRADFDGMLLLLLGPAEDMLSVR
jgi:hypothetical protein